mgnify:CR=1 FL=1
MRPSSSSIIVGAPFAQDDDDGKKEGDNTNSSPDRVSLGPEMKAVKSLGNRERGKWAPRHSRQKITGCEVSQWPWLCPVYYVESW